MLLYERKRYGTGSDTAGVNLLNRIPMQKNEEKNITLLSRRETLEYASQKDYSIARFGDGEIELAYYQGIQFQKKDINLSLKLQQVLVEPIPNLLVCFNNDFVCNDEYKVILDYERSTKDYCRFESVHRLNDIAIMSRKVQRYVYQRQFESIKQCTNINHFGDATCFMLCFFYTEYRDNKINEILNLYRSFLQGKSILFVCPESPLMGLSFRKLYDTDIVKSMKNVDFIVIPDKNCFSYYDSIMQRILSHISIDAVFIQAGPTATVLVADLMANHGILAYDIGSWNVSLQKAAMIHNISF
jgi:hypothetical protein